MTGSLSSPVAFCDSLVRMSPEDRYRSIKALNGNELFCEIVRLRPSLFKEFMWFEKREYLESILVDRITMENARVLANKEKEGLGPASVRELVERCTNDDELWRFEAVPGEKGYALVRAGHVVDYCTLEITTVTRS